MTKEESSRHLNNLLSSYPLPECTELLNQVFDHVTEGIHYAALNESNKERMLDFLESLEELLPSLYKGPNQNTGFDGIRLN